MKTISQHAGVHGRSISASNPKPSRSQALQYALAVGTVALALQLTLFLRPLFAHNLILPYLAAVAVVAWYGGTGPVLLTTLLSVLAIKYLFAYGLGATVSVPADLSQMSAFIGASLMICLLGAARRLSEHELTHSQAELEAGILEARSELARTREALAAELADCRRREEESRESESLLRSCFAGNDSIRGIVEQAAENLIHLFANDAAAAFFGLSGEASSGRFGAAPGDAGELLRSWIGRCRTDATGEAAAPFECVRETPEGTHYLSAAVTFLGTGRNGRPRFAYGIDDVTQRKRLEAQFLQAQKMEAIGVLAGGVAHDFSNLITVIGTTCEFLMNGVAPDDPRRGDLENVRLASHRAAALTSQLLAFSRRQVMQPKVLNLNDVLAGTSAILSRLIGGDIDVVTTPHPDLGRVKADPGQIEQIIMNLAVNARDAMPHGGNLTLETANADLDDEYVRRHPAGSPGRYVMLAVSDNGSGMDKATQSRIFEPFFTTKGQGKGTGLGLSTVYGIVKQSGGFIWVYSELGNGTTFKIYLPRVDEEAEVTDSHGRGETQMRGTETVLVVEDDPLVRALTGRVLRDQGYTVLEAANGREALELSAGFEGNLHLVVTDVVMPEMSGRALVEQIKSERPETRVLFVSGYPDNALFHDGVLARDVAFLQKPFTADMLKQKVREVLDSV